MHITFNVRKRVQTLQFLIKFLLKKMLSEKGPAWSWHNIFLFEFFSSSFDYKIELNDQFPP